MSEIRVKENESLESALKRFKRSCQKDGVKIVMNCEVTPELIKEEKPDSVIIATGSKTTDPSDQGIDNSGYHPTALTFWMAREQQAKKFSLSAVEWLDARQLHSLASRSMM